MRHLLNINPCSFRNNVMEGKQEVHFMKDKENVEDKKSCFFPKLLTE